MAFLHEHGLPWTSHSRAWLGLALFLQGDWDKAGEHYEVALACEPASAMDGWARALLFEYRAYAGQRAEALALLDEPADSWMPTPQQPNTWGRWVMLCAAVEGLYLLGEHARAAELYALVADCIELTAVVCVSCHDGRLAHRTAGIAATAGRRFADAERHYRMALEQAAGLPHLPEQAHTRRFYAAMLLERGAPGDREAAAGLAAEAAELYRRMGMPRHLAMVEGLPI